MKKMTIYFFHKKLPSEAAVRRCSFKKFVLKTFSIFTRKHLKAWRPATLLKRDSKTGVFPVTIWQFLRTLFLQHISVGCFCTMNGWIFCVPTFYSLELIAANAQILINVWKFNLTPLVYFLWEITEDSVSNAQRKVNMKHHGFL